MMLFKRKVREVVEESTNFPELDPAHNNKVRLRSAKDEDPRQFPLSIGSDHSIDTNSLLMRIKKISW